MALDTGGHASPAALQCVVAYNPYGGYCVPLSSRHRPAAQAILAGDVYEPNTIGFIRAHCGTGDVVHAGTYFGDFLPGVSSALAPDARLWAFEPNRENHRCATVTVLLNDLRNVELVHAALGERVGTVDLLTGDPDGRARGGSSRVLAPEEGSTGIVERVPMATIDGCVPQSRHVAVLQLDVEGHEEAALRGAIGTIRRCRPAIVLEILPSSSLPGSEWFAGEVLGLGYRYTGSVHGNAVFMADRAAGPAR